MGFLLQVSGRQQELRVYQDGNLIKTYSISTAKNGFGEAYGSEKTPRGWHSLRAKIGDGAPANTVFVARRPTGELYTDKLGEKYPGRDWMLTRIFWLCGLEHGKNRFGQVDSMKRKIYIHGAPDSANFERPSSRGCIRMKNQDIIELFDLIPINTKIYIHEN